MKENFRSIGLIGYGRFGRLLVEIFRRHAPDIDLRVASSSQPVDRVLFFPAEEVYQADLLIPCVPIRHFETAIRNLAPHVRPGATVLDVCSVKVYPRTVMLAQLPAEANLICSHPMFGPASYQKLGGELRDCCIVLENVRAPRDRYQALHAFFEEFKLHVVEMDADEHDRLAARFHFVTLAAATILKKLQLRRSRIDTKSASMMIDFLEMISVDKELVKDLYEYNAYCKREFELLQGAFQELCVDLQGRAAAAHDSEQHE